MVRECRAIKDWLEEWTRKINVKAADALRYVDQINSIKHVESRTEIYNTKATFLLTS